jgi:D-3-phosphoglycerate dehydrogenase
VPGVIGKVGTLLGKHEINIGAYLLSNDEHQDGAFAAIRLDSRAPADVLDLLMEIPEIISVQQLHC